MPKLLYSGNKTGVKTLVLVDARFDASYTFTSGSCMVSRKDAEIIMRENPRAFGPDPLENVIGDVI